MTLDTIRRLYNNSKQSSIAVYLLLKLLVIFCLIREMILHNYHNALLCLISLILFTLPSFVKDRLKISLPNGLEIAILLFIFAAEILGEIENFFGNISYWDTILHTINGFLAASVGFSLVDLLNNKVNDFNMSPLFVAIFAFCFSMTIGVCWEFFEYSMDTFVSKDMQKDTIINHLPSVEFDKVKSNNVVIIDNIDHTILYDKNNNALITIDNGYLDIGIKDTMEDLFVNLIGALTFSIFGYLYVSDRDKYKFAGSFKIKSIKDK